MKMTLAKKTEWIAALRSGKYIQGTGVLKYKDIDGTVNHCCLGVLEELYGTKQIAPEHCGSFSFIDTGNNDSFQGAVLTTQTAEALSCDHNGPRIPLNLLTPEELNRLAQKNKVAEEELDASYPPEGVAVSELNDTGFSFNRIADLLEIVIEVVPE